MVMNKLRLLSIVACALLVGMASIGLLRLSWDAWAENVAKVRVGVAIPGPSIYHGAAWSRDGQRLAAYSWGGNDIFVWDTTGHLLNAIHRESYYDGNSLAFVGDGQQLVTSPTDVPHGNVVFSVYDIKTGSIVHQARIAQLDRFGRPYRDSEFTVSPDGSLLAAAFGSEFGQRVTIYSTENWTVVATVPETAETPANPMAFAFSPDSRFLAVGRYDGMIVIYDIAGQKTIRRFSPFPDEAGGAIGTLSYSPDGRALVVGAAVSTDATRQPDGRWKPVLLPDPLRVFAVDDGTLLASLRQPVQPIRRLSWDPKSRFIAFIRMDLTLHLWSPFDKTSAEQTVSQPGLADFFSLSPDGRHAALCNGTWLTILDISD